MFLPELRKLFRRCLFSQNGDSRIARYKFNQQRNHRDDSPDDQQQDRNASECAKRFVLCGRAQFCESQPRMDFRKSGANNNTVMVRVRQLYTVVVRENQPSETARSPDNRAPSLEC